MLFLLLSLYTTKQYQQHITINNTSSSNSISINITPPPPPQYHHCKSTKEEGRRARGRRRGERETQGPTETSLWRRHARKRGGGERKGRGTRVGRGKMEGGGRGSLAWYSGLRGSLTSLEHYYNYATDTSTDDNTQTNTTRPKHTHTHTHQTIDISLNQAYFITRILHSAKTTTAARTKTTAYAGTFIINSSLSKKTTQTTYAGT